MFQCNYDDRDYSSASQGYDNELNENKAKSYHERKSANDEKKVIVFNLSLGTVSLRYCGRQHSRNLGVQHLETWVSIQTRNGIMMS